VRVNQQNRVSMEQAVERVREIFPQLSQREIELEIQRGFGNVELAIINLTNRMV